MTQKTLVVLVVLNVVLLVGLLLTGGPQPQAQAQFAGSPIFQMIAAETGVGDSDVIAASSSAICGNSISSDMRCSCEYGRLKSPGGGDRHRNATLCEIRRRPHRGRRCVA